MAHRGDAALPQRATPIFDRSYRLLEHAFRVRTELRRAGALVDRHLAPFRTTRDEASPTYVLALRSGTYPYVLYRDGRRVQSAPSYTDLLDYFFATVHQDALEGNERFVAVHASAASWRGRGLVFPAPMDSGKTTLVAGLVRAGFDYLTDEAALFDAETAELHPFPKVLWMEASTVRSLPGLQRRLSPEYRRLSRARSYVRPQDLRPGAVGGPCRLGFVIAPSFRGGTETRLRPMTRAEALMVLVRNAFNFRRFGKMGLSVLREAIRDAECYTLTMGDLDSAVRVVNRVVGAKDAGT